MQTNTTLNFTVDDKSVVIKEVTDTNIILQINGDIKRIPNELAALKQCLASYNMTSIQHANNIYNIAHISEANFSFATGRMAFNELLTKRLIRELIKYNPQLEILGEKLKAKNGWEKQPGINNTVKDVITESFTGLIGIQLRKLFAIGKYPPSEDKNHKYIEHCILTCKRSLQLLCFILISELWNITKKRSCSISPHQRDALKSFFENEFYQDIEGSLNLLKHLYTIFIDNNLELPIPELIFISDLLQNESDFDNACKKLHSLHNSLEQFTYSPLDCFEAETQISYILMQLAFLANYHMVSMKTISYDEVRNNPPYFLHCYITLGVKTNSDNLSKVFRYEKDAVCTDTIFFFREHYKKSINLFPFVVDLNAIQFEEGTKIYFFDSVNYLENSLNYVFIEDNARETIKFLNMAVRNNDINDIMNDSEKRKLYKLDTVFLQFQEAKKCILKD